MTISKISDHKNKKKYQKIVTDITAILNVLSLTKSGLSYFKCYISVQEIVSVIATNIALMELQLEKYKKELQRINES